jgi:hypothetical protein
VQFDRQSLPEAPDSGKEREGCETCRNAPDSRLLTGALTRA